MSSLSSRSMSSSSASSASSSTSEEDEETRKTREEEIRDKNVEDDNDDDDEEDEDDDQEDEEEEEEEIQDRDYIGTRRTHLDQEEEEDMEEDDDDEEDQEFPGNPESGPPPPSHPDPWTIFRPVASKKKPGILYLSCIPPGFNVSATTSFFSKFGKVGRVFLQPDNKSGVRKEKFRPLEFREGWIEFVSKRVAQEVAANLNTTPVGGKKRSKAHDVLWNIKYLPRFKWSHLTERLNYEKAVHHQKMRNEIVQAKRDADYFKSNVERSKRMRKNKSESDINRSPYEFRQKETDDAIRSSKRKRSSSSTSLLNNSDPTAPKRAKGGTEPATSPNQKKMISNKKNKGKGKKSSSLNRSSSDMLSGSGGGV